MITILAGGIGAAKLIRGLIEIVPHEDLTIIVNTGDDQNDCYGLYVSPDIDIIMYTITNIVNPDTGWGINGDSFNCLKMLKNYGYETWFQLGDKDLATHIFRTQLYRQGKKLDEITSILCEKLGIRIKILPMTNQFVPTYIQTTKGIYHFEEYLIKQNAKDEVIDVIYKNIENAKPAPKVIDSIRKSDGIIICPSNPIVSIRPILKIRRIKDAIKEKNTVSISPIVGDRPVKGPADKLMMGLGYEVSAFGVANIYRNIINSFIIDNIDKKYTESIKKLGIKVYKFDTIMNSLEKKINLAKFTLNVLFHK
ncbi:MAG: 2-phospho-L-lactate transferase [Candidatus Helarchaeota archaeon]